MAQFTKKAILDSFVELISERPFDKITVKDIVTRCGVNRNTFYYYFEDVYALVDELFQVETQNILGSNADYETWQEAFLKGIDFVHNNRRAIYHLYNSISHEQVETYLNKVTYNNILIFIKKSVADLSPTEKDVELVASFYSHALVGMTLEWLSGGMKGDPHDFVIRISELLDGTVRYCFLKNTDKQV